MGATASRYVGLDYLRLGHPLKLAAHLHSHGAIYVLDEPTTGLHLSDIARLLDVLDRLVDERASTVITAAVANAARQIAAVLDQNPVLGTGPYPLTEVHRQLAEHHAALDSTLIKSYSTILESLSSTP